MHSRLVRGALDLGIVGTVLASYVLHNQLYAPRGDRYRKALDVSDPEVGAYERWLGIWGNTIQGRPDDLLLEALPGLKGLRGLEANHWDSPTPRFVVRDTEYSAITDALAAEPSAFA